MKTQSLHEKLSSLHTATPQSVKSLAGLFVPVTFRKGTLLMAPEHSYPILYLIDNGLLRGYFQYQNEEHTTWIMEEGFLLPLGGLFINEPSMEQVEFLEETIGWSLNIAKAGLLVQKEPQLYKMIIEIYEQKLADSKNINSMLRIRRAGERVEFVQKIRKNLIYRVLNRHLASFLNIGDKYLFAVKKKGRDSVR
ncbi:MAG: Crp/Fnr family transcriptional regulator [Chitinophagaceae bacterium]|nr:MAG: Crp/Fnr family transcriptional regulator [Chitinophagaceae bacterium]